MSSLLFFVDGGRKHYSAPKGTLHYSPSALKKHNSNRKELVPSREHPVKGHHKHDVPKQTPKVPMNIAHPHVHIHEQPIAVRLKQQVEKHAQKVNTKPHNIIKPIQSHAYYNKNIRINSFRPEIIVKGGNRVTMPIRVNQNPPNLSGRRNITAIAMFNKPANRISGLPGSQINLIKPRQQSRLQSRLPLGIQPGRPAPHSKPANHQIAQGRLLQSLGAGMRELGINPISFNRAGGSFNKPINAAGILSQFPELIRNGMNEETLRRLNEHVPNLESKIYAHFASRNKKPALYHNPMHHDLATSNIAFMKNYQNHVLSKQNFGLTNHRPLERAGPLESLVPYSNNIPKNLPPSYFTKGSSGSTNELTSQDINDIASLTAQAKQSSDNSGLLSTAERFLSSTDGLLRNSLLSSSRLNTNVAPYLNERDTGALPSLNRPSSSSPYRLPGSAQQGFMHQPTKTFSYLNNMAQNGLPSYPYYPFNQRTSMMENQSMSRQGFPQQLNNQYNQISYFSPPMYTHSWSEYSPCSVTCGPGARKRHRRCGIPDCPSGGVQIESIPCFARSCTGKNDTNYFLYITFIISETKKSYNLL